MGLTSKTVLFLAVFVMVALFALAVWLWPRLSRRGWRAAVRRVGLVLAGQLAILAVGGLTANNTFGFFTSWSDLASVFQRSQEDPPAGRAAAGLRVLGHESVNVPGGSVPEKGGRIDKVDVRGAGSKISSSAYVYLPPEYFQPEFKNTTFPTSIVLTGYPGTAEALIKGLRYPQTAWKLARQKKAQPMILIMLRPSVTGQWDTECMNVPGGPQAASFFARDLPKEMRNHYRIGRQRESLGIIGNSTGGFCALKLAMEYPHVFSAAGSLSGYFKPATDPTTGDLYKGDKQLEQRSNLLWRQQHVPAPPTSFLVTTSKQGEHNYQDTLRFITQTKSPSRVSSIILDRGGHNFNTWRREIPGTLSWISSRLQSPKP
ncbi:alpha/beta hydrolase [Streptomyces sp. NPDC001339]|uniref:alpha/beta hydrolase n=1 Tax=Streptomyces sp. NPDC001339 TaxID=3364563 RepID=UPI0036C968A5